jgi:hypothetical protein
VADPVCPKCGEAAERQATRYGTRHAHCGLWSWGGKPLTDAETHAARRAAHHAFDALWKAPNRLMMRREAYALLAKELGLPKGTAHMATMDRAMAERVPVAVARIRNAVLLARLEKEAQDAR